MREVGVSHRGRNTIFCFFCILFYREAFCYFQEAKLFHYIFLKTCAVMCEVIQLLYSKCNGQDQLNGQMHTGTCSALVMIMRARTVHRFVVSNINLAFNQTTFMYSMRRVNPCPSTGCPSSNAIDGDHSTTATRCSITNQVDNHWWAVELLREDNIANVVITSRDRWGRKEKLFQYHACVMMIVL